MTDIAQTELLSTGEMARRLGRSLSGIRKLERQGRIPPAIVIVGSGKKVWPAADFPAIAEGLEERSRRQGAAA